MATESLPLAELGPRELLIVGETVSILSACNAAGADPALFLARLKRIGRSHLSRDARLRALEALVARWRAPEAA
jgi:hypothetical protein